MSDNETRPTPAQGETLPATQGAAGTNVAIEGAGGLKEIKLKSLEFTDLFFSENGDAFIRGLENAEGPLAPVPAEAFRDLDILHQRVCKLGQEQNEFSLDYDEMRFRVSKIEDVQGVWYTLRRAKWPIPRLGELGLPPMIIRYLAALGRPGKHGLLIIAGKTGEGKTTTACSLLQEYLTYFGDVAVTIEDPIELPMSGAHGNFGHCFQTEVKNGDFAAAMRLTMRRSPRYILLGEVRGAHEASQAIKAAVNGHLVITTIHAGNCTEALTSLLKFVSTEEDMTLARSILADGLAGVIHQQLIRIKGRSGRGLKVQYLFPGNEQGIRSKIRDGKFEQLGTDIAAQAQRVSMNQMPTAI